METAISNVSLTSAKPSGPFSNIANGFFPTSYPIPPSPQGSPTHPSKVTRLVSDPRATQTSVDMHFYNAQLFTNDHVDEPKGPTGGKSGVQRHSGGTGFLGVTAEMYIDVHFRSAVHEIRHIFSENRDFVRVRDALCILGLRRVEAELLWRLVMENQAHCSCQK
ncbi:hypothetical protein FRC03_012726 [Tulasnella sp. 419]|nr:hypothetical protein FRC03_012726 [Tulasnella sp. 419]